MKSMMLSDIRKIKICDIPKPQIENSTDVLLRIKKVGVCGSDVHYYKFGKIGDQSVSFPSTLGHECSAVVEKIGDGVTKLKPGDLVAVDPAVSCFNCDQCQMGRFHTCQNLKFLAVPGQLQGCLSEFIVMPETNCYSVGREINEDLAVLVEPLTIGFYSVGQSCELRYKNVVILGVGPIGLSVLQMVRLKNPSKIFCTDKLDYRLKIAQKIGADWIGNPDRLDIVKNIEKEESLFLDVVFECCGQQEALNQAIKILKPGGKLIIVGIPKGNSISFNINELRRKEISIINIRRQNECVQSVIDLIDNKKIKPEFMITHHFSFKETEEAFKLVSEYEDCVIKAVINVVS